MTKREKSRRKMVIKRSDKAIKKLNSKKRHVQTDIMKAIEFFEANNMPFEEGSNNGITPYLFINFDDEGKATKPD